MDTPNAIDNVADKALSAGSTAAKLLGVVNPTAATVGVVADLIQKRRSQKFINRLEKLVHSLDRRVQRLEDISQSGPDVDLLDEIIAQAISDEDEDKLEYYSALIEYCSSNSISPQEVRLLSSAFKSLLVSEIKGFADFAKGRNFLANIANDLVPIFWNRVLFLGLNKTSGGGVKHASQVSELGKHFVKIVNLVNEEDG